MFYRSAAIRFCSPFTAVSLEAGETLLPGSRRNTRHVMATSPPLRMAGVFLYVKSILVHAWLMQRETIGLYITYSLLFKRKLKHFSIGNPDTKTENELTRPYQRLSYFSDPVRFPTSSGHGQQKCSLVLWKKLIMHINYVALPKQDAMFSLPLLFSSS